MCYLSQAVLQNGQQLMVANHSSIADIQRRCSQLDDMWRELKLCSNSRYITISKIIDKVINKILYENHM